MTTDAASIGSSGVATFHIAASNHGSASADNVGLLHVLPRNRSIVNISTLAGTCIDPTGPIGEWVLVTCRVGSLGPGESVAVTVEATIGDAAGTRLLSGVLAGHAPTLDAEKANNAASVEWTVSDVPGGDPPP
jgi:Domain of unknown function DUF11